MFGEAYVAFFPEVTDLFVLLTDSEQNLAETLLQQPKKMACAKQTVRFMKERAKKKKKTKPTPTSTTSPLSSPSGRGEKRKQPKSGSRPMKRP